MRHILSFHYDSDLKPGFRFGVLQQDLQPGGGRGLISSYSFVLSPIPGTGTQPGPPGSACAPDSLSPDSHHAGTFASLRCPPPGHSLREEDASSGHGRARQGAPGHSPHAQVLSGVSASGSHPLTARARLFPFWVWTVSLLSPTLRRHLAPRMQLLHHLLP